MKQRVVRLVQKNVAVQVNKILARFNLFVLYRIGAAIGDQVCMSAVVRMLHEQYGFKIMVICTYPEIFKYNPRVWKMLSFYEIPAYFRKSVRRLIDFLCGDHIENFCFPSVQGRSLAEYMRETKTVCHLVEAHSKHFKLPLQYGTMSPEIYLSTDEIKHCKEKYRLPEPYAVIQSMGKTSFTPVKEWGAQNFQAVTKLLDRINWVQVGTADDPILEGAVNLCGKTSLRELACIIRGAKFVLSVEGLLNHLAAAFATLSFVVFSGYLPTHIALYPHTIPIAMNSQLACRPCGLLQPCPYRDKPCMQGMTPDYVAAIIRENLHKSSATSEVFCSSIGSV